jgi:hypothetical protein
MSELFPDDRELRGGWPSVNQICVLYRGSLLQEYRSLYAPTGLTVEKFYLLPIACIDVFYTYLRTNSEFYSLKLVFVTEMESVYCAIRTGSLNKTDFVSSLKSY